ncbi:MAG: hypothetical protein ABSD13_13305 [Candidatus Korobacteraceae bacterium]|jgi:hypothetical protein
MFMTCELAYLCAARHHECAAFHHKEAAKHEAAGAYEKAAQHAYRAHGHTQHAIQSEAEAAKLHADRFLHVDQFGRSRTASSEQGASAQSNT